MGTKSKNIALLIVVLLLVFVATFQQTAVAQPTNSSVVPATLWQQNYRDYAVLDGRTLSNLIQTSDGGFAYIRGANIVKTDSKNQTQWEKHVTYTQPQSVFEKENHWPVRVEGVELCSLIETSDGSLAAIGTVVTVYDMPYNGMASLIKTETFLPLPTPTPTSAIPEFSSWTIPLLLTLTLALAGLLVYHKKHKTKVTQP